jgi:Flp pilus assembly protein TadB
MRADGSPSRLREALTGGRRELLLYLATGVAYIAIGVAAPEFLFAWVVAVGFLLVTVVLLPALVRRVRRAREAGL